MKNTLNSNLIDSSACVPATSGVATIRELTGSALEYMQCTLRSAAFKEISLKFIQRINDTEDGPDDRDTRLLRVLQIMAFNEYDWDFELGYSWLDTNGYGDRTVSWLGKMLTGQRQAVK